MDSLGLVQATMIAGVATTLLTEIQKSQYWPVPVQKYPRFTALVLSLATSAYEVYRYNQVNFATLNWANWLSIAGFTLLVSAMVYNHIIKGA